MEKNWLIRTKNNHILGPVSKAKVQDLIIKGSIKGDDEVCSGNGYWFYIREQDLVAKYVIDGAKQGFNPVSEAEPVGAISPPESDLEYPDIDDIIAKVNSTSETTYQKSNVPPSTISVETLADEPALSSPSVAEIAKELNLQSNESEFIDDLGDDVEILPEDNDLEYPDEMAVKALIHSEFGGGAEELSEPESEPPKKKPVPKPTPKPIPIPIPKKSEAGNENDKVVPIKKKVVPKVANVQAPKLKRRRRAPTPLPEVKKDSKVSVKLLYILVILFFIMAVIAVTKRENIMNEINKRVSLNIISSAVAQDTPVIKKKSGLSKK